MKRREFTLPTLLGLLVATVGLFTGIWLVQRQRNPNVAANSTEAPVDMKIANVSDTGFNVSWTTVTAVPGFVQYGENSTTPDIVVSDERDQTQGSVGNYFTHFVTLKGLKPATIYVFKIGSGKGLFDNNGQNYQITTAVAVATQPAADVAYGQVVTKSGDPADGALIYAQLPGAGLLAGLVKSGGSWVIPLSTARTGSGSGFATYDKTTPLSISVVDGSMGSATVITAAGKISPVPQIALGNNYDFTVAESPATGSASASRFSQINAAFESQTNSPTEINVTSPQLGEQINTTKPVISGDAPPGTKITVVIHSTQTITATVTAAKDGTFTYSVPSDLAPGDHTLTISAVINGITQTITRTFTVYAAGESSLPAYSATPSATIKPSPSPTMTPTPMPTAAPTPVVNSTTQAAPTATPRPTLIPTLVPTVVPTAAPPPAATATMSAIPVSGETEGTWLTLILGTLLLATGAWWYKKTAA